MSTFDVKVRKLDAVEPHPNADRLELAVIGGFRAVVQKGVYSAGQDIVYIPTDAVIPDEISIALKIKDYLVGKKKNRVKAIKLRGEVSQGIVLQVRDVLKVCIDKCGLDSGEILVVEDIAKTLGIEKYEEPIPMQMQGKARPWPGYLDKYDVENVNRQEAMHLLVDDEVIATEKLHGSNMAVSVAVVDGEIEEHVCSRNFSLEYEEGNLYWEVAIKHQLLPKLHGLIEYIESPGLVDVNELTIRGEVVGVQDLKYGFNKGQPGFFAFDIRLNGDYLDWEQFTHLCEEADIPTVPVVYEGPYGYEMLKMLSKGNSKLADHTKEGIVVKPIGKTRYERSFGRVIVKFINEDYLTRKGGTELH